MSGKGREDIEVGGRDMRHIPILGIVLLISISVANAAVLIGVDELMNPGYVDVQIGGTANISIWTDSSINPGGDFTFGFLGIHDGEPGMLSGGVGDPHILIYPPTDPQWELPPGFSSGFWFSYDGIEPVPGGGLLIDGIIFECSGIGNVNLWLYGTTDFMEMNLYDMQTIHQIPEPGTIAFLGLGAMLLKRRR
jgi:hypothetical protein